MQLENSIKITKSKPIFLVGFMAAGKSTLAKKIALKLNFDFIDLDEFIENTYQLSITQIFEKFGNQKFREIEHNSLLKLMDKQNTVISTGGGTPCYFSNMELMNQNGITIFIDVPLQVIIWRLKNAKNPRPMLKNIKPEEFDVFVNSLFFERLPFYSTAHMRFNPVDENLNFFIQKIKNYIFEKNFE